MGLKLFIYQQSCWEDDQGNWMDSAIAKGIVVANNRQEADRLFKEKSGRELSLALDDVIEMDITEGAIWLPDVRR
jgi:hypothetical protein